MNTYKIKSYLSGEVLYQSAATSFKKCLESAIIENITLEYANLRYQNLAGANLDNACLKYSSFDEANLTGANLSEADLLGSSFVNCSLQNSCLCLADITNCNFDGALFGDTDIAGAKIDNALFSTLSAFSLSFKAAEPFKKCHFKDLSGTTTSFSSIPVTIHGLDLQVSLLDDHMMIGHETKTYQEWAEFMRINHHEYSKERIRIRALLKQHHKAFLQLGRVRYKYLESPQKKTTISCFFDRILMYAGLIPSLENNV